MISLVYIYELKISLGKFNMLRIGRDDAVSFKEASDEIRKHLLDEGIDLSENDIIKKVLKIT